MEKTMGIIKKSQKTTLTKWYLLGLNIALLSVLPGCATVGPNYVSPAFEEVDLYGDVATQQQLNTALDKKWWRFFDDEQLLSLVEIADENNLSIAIASANVERASAVFDDIEDDDWPSGGLISTYSAQRQVPALPGDSGTNERSTLRTRQFGLTSSLVLDVAGRLRRAEEAANAQREEALLLWYEARLSVLSNVSRLYIEYRSIQNRLVVAETTLSTFLETETVVANQLEAGLSSQLDALRVKSQVSDIRSQIPLLQAQLTQLRNAITALVGGEANTTGINWQENTIPTFSHPLPLSNSNKFLSKRPDVRAAERRLASATASIGVATADLYPSISMTGFLGYFSTQGPVIGSDAKAWSIIPSLNWEILDLDSVKARIRAAEADNARILAEFEQTVLNAIAESRTAISNYVRFEERLIALEQQVNANEEALSLAQFQYQNGALSLLDLLDVERQWLASRDRFADGKAQVALALVDIHVSLGGGVLNM